MTANGGSGSKSMCHGRDVTRWYFLSITKCFILFLELFHPPPSPGNSSKARYRKRQLPVMYCTVLVPTFVRYGIQFVPEYYLPELQFLKRALVLSWIRYFQNFRILSKLTGSEILYHFSSVVDPLWFQRGFISGSREPNQWGYGYCGQTLK